MRVSIIYKVTPEEEIFIFPEVKDSVTRRGFEPPTTSRQSITRSNFEPLCTLPLGYDASKIFGEFIYVTLGSFPNTDDYRRLFLCYSKLLNAIDWHVLWRLRLPISCHCITDINGASLLSSSIKSQHIWQLLNRLIMFESVLRHAGVKLYIG